MFIAGILKHCYPAWKEIISDSIILNMINEGLQINFKNNIPSKEHEQEHFQRGSDVISKKINKSLQVITKCD